MAQRVWEDFELGQRFGTASLTVTEAHIVGFAGLTGDFYPLHMDEVYASKTNFGTRIAHGPLTFCLAVGLVGQTGIFQDSLVAFLGADRMRFQHPVRAGDTVHVEVLVSQKKESSRPDRGVTVMEYTVKNQKDEAVATVEMSFLMHRRQ